MARKGYTLYDYTNTPEAMNNELMQQCREEAEARYPTPIATDLGYKNMREAYAAALYAERSKPQPKCITVDVAMEVVEVWAIVNEPYMTKVSFMSLRERLTKAANQ
jgi:hypothetical protein